MVLHDKRRLYPRPGDICISKGLEVQGASEGPGEEVMSQGIVEN